MSKIQIILNYYERLFADCSNYTLALYAESLIYMKSDVFISDCCFIGLINALYRLCSKEIALRFYNLPFNVKDDNVDNALVADALDTERKFIEASVLAFESLWKNESL